MCFGFVAASGLALDTLQQLNLVLGAHGASMQAVAVAVALMGLAAMAIMLSQKLICSAEMHTKYQCMAPGCKLYSVANGGWVAQGC